MPAAVCVIYGTKLSGGPMGNSPISAEGCAPIGLKYRKEIALSFSEESMVSQMISSAICFGISVW